MLHVCHKSIKQPFVDIINDNSIYVDNVKRRAQLNFGENLKTSTVRSQNKAGLVVEMILHALRM